MDVPKIEDVKDLSGKRVLVRVDFNVPVEMGRVVNDFRIKAVLPTITFLTKAGAKVVLISHFSGKEANSLKPVSDHLKKILPHTYIASTDPVVIGEAVIGMNNGEVVLLPNLRFWAGEEMCEEHFAHDFSTLADIYVNEAFSVSHRNHASIVLLPTFLPSYAGIHFIKEIENLSRAFKPDEPFLFILGGAKFSTKQPLVNKFLLTATKVFIGGALANDFFAERGYEVGTSLLSNPRITIPKEILGNEKLMLPIDVTVRKPDKTLEIKRPDQVLPEEKIVDVGDATLSLLRGECEKSKFILWNGPLGIYEEGVVKQTEELAIAAAESLGTSIIGGGDTVAAITRLQLESAFDFVSTGGGAMLEFLVKETLPGIEVLKKTKIS